ncbi:hypothetical protein GCM10009851_23100 [Herbiconiux moechotypicola]|uniref:Uncharacterized protein n=2 Tax=Herbiconiux moechotypicola TaxID=637393 RepID=A0ABN3DNE0_9MICO
MRAAGMRAAGTRAAWTHAAGLAAGLAVMAVVGGVAVPAAASAEIVGSVGSVGSAGTVGSVGSAGSAGSTGSGGVEVSADGHTFTTSIDSPLFADLPVVVPGDSVSATLWVRNGGVQAGAVRFSASDGWSTSAAFADHLLVSASPSDPVVAPGAEVPLGSVDECALLFAGPVLQPGESIPLLVTLAFAPTVGGRDGAGARAGLDFVAALRDPADPASPTADCSGGTVIPGIPDSGDGGSVPRADAIAATGLVPIGAAMLGAIVLVAGIALFASGRRRSPRDAREWERSEVAETGGSHDRGAT